MGQVDDDVARSVGDDAGECVDDGRDRGDVGVAPDGNGGNDTVTGTAFVDKLNGNDGDDTMTGASAMTFSPVATATTP